MDSFSLLALFLMDSWYSGVTFSVSRVDFMVCPRCVLGVYEVCTRCAPRFDTTTGFSWSFHLLYKVEC